MIGNQLNLNRKRVKNTLEQQERFRNTLHPSKLWGKINKGGYLFHSIRK